MSAKSPRGTVDLGAHCGLLLRCRAEMFITDGEFQLSPWLLTSQLRISPLMNSTSPEISVSFPGLGCFAALKSWSPPQIWGYRIPNPRAPSTLLHTCHCKQGTNSHLLCHRFHLSSNFIDLMTVLSMSSQSRYTASCAHTTTSYCTLNPCQTRAASNYSTGRMKM